MMMLYHFDIAFDNRIAVYTALNNTHLILLIINTYLFFIFCVFYCHNKDLNEAALFFFCAHEMIA